MDNSMQQYLDELQIKIIDLQEEKFALMNLSKLYPDMIIVYHGKKPYFCTKFINNKVNSIIIKPYCSCCLDATHYVDIFFSSEKNNLKIHSDPHRFDVGHWGGYNDNDDSYLFVRNKTLMDELKQNNIADDVIQQIEIEIGIKEQGLSD